MVVRARRGKYCAAICFTFRARYHAENDDHPRMNRAQASRPIPEPGKYTADSLESKNAQREDDMIYRIGRALQIAGMVILPVGMVGNILDEHKVRVQDSLMVAAVGVAVFVVGWLLQQAGRPR
jgi:hypothetical protein